MEQLRILVCGATGRLGRLAVTLAERGHRVRAATREPGSQHAQRLLRPGIELVAADFDRTDSLVVAARGVDAVFAAGTAHAAGPAADVRHGKNVVDAARDAGVGHLVYVTVAGATRPTGVPVLDSKHAVEQHLREAGVPFTVIAPAYFMENLWNPWNRPALAAGLLPGPVPPDRLLQQVCIDDVVAFSALVLEERTPFLGARIELAADELTGADAATVVADLTGQPVRPVGPYPAPPNPLFVWLDRTGTQIDVPDVRARYPQVDWHDFRAWATGQDWRVLTNG